jgi:hypothetical protein
MVGFRMLARNARLIPLPTYPIGPTIGEHVSMCTHAISPAVHLRGFPGVDREQIEIALAGLDVGKA